MSGQIVNVPQHQAAYNASKAGVAHLTASLAVEWADRGMRVNAIAPGYFLSEMTRQFTDANPELRDRWVAAIPAGRMGRAGGPRRPRGLPRLRLLALHHRTVHRHRRRLHPRLSRPAPVVRRTPHRWTVPPSDVTSSASWSSNQWPSSPR